MNQRGNWLAAQTRPDLSILASSNQQKMPQPTVGDIRRRAHRHLEKGRVVILAAGTGSPFVTTDTAATQRALELEADVVLKATRVDGVYSDDPERNPHAVLYRELNYSQVLEQNLRVMDHTAITQCMEHGMPLLVFNFKRNGNIERAVNGEAVGTYISSEVKAET